MGAASGMLTSLQLWCEKCRQDLESHAFGFNQRGTNTCCDFMCAMFCQVIKMKKQTLFLEMTEQEIWASTSQLSPWETRDTISWSLWEWFPMKNFWMSERSFVPLKILQVKGHSNLHSNFHCQPMQGQSMQVSILQRKNWLQTLTNKTLTKH